MILAATTGVALLAGTGACAAGAENDDGTLDVVAAFYPLQFLAEQVTESAEASVTVLAPPGVDAHDLELSPSQVADVSDADVVLYLREFQPAVDEAVATHAPDAGFDVAEVVPLLDAPHEHGDEDSGEEHGHEEHGHEEHEGDEHGHDAHEHDEQEGEEHDHEEHEGEEHGHDDHAHGDVDPHLWLDPTRYATVADALADRLATVDPDQSSAYETGAREFGEELADLDGAYQDGLADCARREIVVSHAAFGYLADRYDLRQVPVSGLAPEEEPSPGQLAEVIEEAERVGATTIFFEVLVDPSVAEVIATEVGAETAKLDPVEGLSASSADEDYLSIMRDNLDQLRTALGCA